MTVRTRTLLLIGADTTHYRLLRQQLLHAGYDAVLVHDGYQALEMMRVRAYSLVLLGSDSNQASSLHMLRQMRQNDMLKELPVIVVTPPAMPTVAETYLIAGANDYLAYPISFTLLQSRLEAWLRELPPGTAEHTSLVENKLELLTYERELQIGQQIQADFLPKQLPETRGWEIAAYFEPAREVAGDFYDAFTLTQNRRLGFLIADVCDKGVGAALFMALFRSLLRAFANQRHSMTWADVLDDNLPPTLRQGDKSQRQAAITMIGANALKSSVMMTNAYMVENHRHARMYATLFFGILDPTTGSLIYINGGHNPPLLISKGTIRETLEPTGPVVGIFPKADYELGHIQMEPGDILFSYTDGLADARDARGAFFTEQRLFDLAKQPAESANSLLQRIEQQVHAHIANAPQFDDITMLVVRRTVETMRQPRSTGELTRMIEE
jgi:sigma-B regulation protein RsbU (phosphoserine phosphatase)